LGDWASALGNYEEFSRLKVKVKVKTDSTAFGSVW